MKRSRDSDDDDVMDDFNPSNKIKSDSLLVGDNFEDEQGYLNMDNSERKVWLVKVPKFLFDKWSNVKEEGIDYGKLKIKNVPNSKSAIDVTLELNDRFSQDIPKNYKLQFTNYSPKKGVIPTNEYIFTDNGKGAGVSVEGIVHNEATISPIVDEHYKNIMQSRTLDASTPKRQTIILTKEEEREARRLPTKNDGDSFAMQPVPKKIVKEKRQRLPHDDVIALLFQAYAEHQYWNFKGLAEYTHQPQTYLKEILGEIAQLVKRGSYSGTYELKEEYKNNIGELAKNNYPDEMDGKGKKELK